MSEPVRMGQGTVIDTQKKPSIIRQAIDDVDGATVETRRAAWLGLALGISFTICAVTGLFSWAASDDQSWWPSRPAELYRVSQGAHLISGFVSVPLLLAKLRTVAPKLVQRPFITSFAHLVERITLLPLVGGSIFLLFSGVTNVEYWYPQDFFGIDIGYFFPAAHGKMSIVVMGALVAHIGAKITLTRQALRPDAIATESREAAVDRRRFLGGVAATSTLVGLTVAGATIYPLRRVAVLSARHPDRGPQGMPVNRTARRAGVPASSIDRSTYRLTVERSTGEELASFSLADLREIAQFEHVLPISCVEGWSASATWKGVRLHDLLAVAGVVEPVDVEVVSMQTPGLRYGRSTVSADLVGQDDTLLALEINGEILHEDHGYPVRLIAPNRPGVNQTKWLGRVIVA